MAKLFKLLIASLHNDLLLQNFTIRSLQIEHFISITLVSKILLVSMFMLTNRDTQADTILKEQP